MRPEVRLLSEIDVLWWTEGTAAERRLRGAEAAPPRTPRVVRAFADANRGTVAKQRKARAQRLLVAYVLAGGPIDTEAWIRSLDRERAGDELAEARSGLRDALTHQHDGTSLLSYERRTTARLPGLGADAPRERLRRMLPGSERNAGIAVSQRALTTVNTAEGRTKIGWIAPELIESSDLYKLVEADGRGDYQQVLELLRADGDGWEPLPLDVGDDPWWSALRDNVRDDLRQIAYRARRQARTAIRAGDERVARLAAESWPPPERDVPDGRGGVGGAGGWIAGGRRRLGRRRLVAAGAAGAALAVGAVVAGALVASGGSPEPVGPARAAITPLHGSEEISFRDGGWPERELAGPAGTSGAYELPGVRLNAYGVTRAGAMGFLTIDPQGEERSRTTHAEVHAGDAVRVNVAVHNAGRRTAEDVRTQLLVPHHPGREISLVATVSSSNARPRLVAARATLRAPVALALTVDPRDHAVVRGTSAGDVNVADVPGITYRPSGSGMNIVPLARKGQLVGDQLSGRISGGSGGGFSRVFYLLPDVGDWPNETLSPISNRELMMCQIERERSVESFGCATRSDGGIVLGSLAFPDGGFEGPMELMLRGDRNDSVDTSYFATGRVLTPADGRLDVNRPGTIVAARPGDVLELRARVVISDFTSAPDDQEVLARDVRASIRLLQPPEPQRIAVADVVVGASNTSPKAITAPVIVAADVPIRLEPVPGTARYLRAASEIPSAPSERMDGWPLKDGLTTIVPIGRDWRTSVDRLDLSDGIALGLPERVGSVGASYPSDAAMLSMQVRVRGEE